MHEHDHKEGAAMSLCTLHIKSVRCSIRLYNPFDFVYSSFKTTTATKHYLLQWTATMLVLQFLP